MKYEILALFPLTATEEELKAGAVKVEERIKETGGTVVSGAPVQKGRLHYPISNTRQGYYHMIQFEMEPSSLPEFRRGLLLAGQTLRFTISKVQGEFKAFMPTAPRATTAYSPRPSRPVSPQTPVTQTAGVAPSPSPLSQETIKPEGTPKVTMEELDKRLEEILGE